MAEKRPLALYDGRIEELRAGDTLRGAMPSLEPDLNVYQWRTDFDVGATADGYGLASSGTGSSTAAPNQNISTFARRVFGIARLVTGTSSTGVAAASSHSSNSAAWYFIYPTGDGRTHTFSTALVATALPDGTNGYWVSAGYAGNNDTTSFGTAIHLVYGTNFGLPLSNRWYLRTSSFGTATLVDTGVDVTGDGATLQRLRLVVSPSPLTATAYIDDTQVAQSTTNMPPTGWRSAVDVRIVKTAGTTSRDLYVDWLGFRVEGAR